jgi:predicted AlkP superfamily phosphohydrolase/phosphomutase
VLPGYSEGLVRINVAGRDGESGIAPEEFDATCAELIELIEGLADGRTGEPLAEEIIRVRETPEEGGEEQSPADLMVLWREKICTDVAAHPRFGSIGPVPFFRSGGHATEGFLLASGPSFERGRRLPDLETADVTATLLDRLGIAVPEHVGGRPIGKARPLAV